MSTGPHMTLREAIRRLDLRQPLDSDLTAIAALTTTTFGRGLLALADAAAGRAAFGVVPARQLLAGFFRQTITAGATALQMTRYVGSAISLSFTMPSPGVITGLTVFSNTAVTAGTATFEVYKNAAATGVSVVMSTASPNGAYRNDGAVAFAAGDKLDIRITTSADYAPVTSNNVQGAIEYTA